MTVSTYRPAIRSAALCRLIADLADLTTADLCDRHPTARVPELDLVLRGARRRFYGPVRTVRCDGDGLPHQLLDGPGTGAVLVIDAGGGRGGAVLGDRLATVAAGQGWAGVLVHGAVRDAAQLATVDLGIASTATTPRSVGPSCRGAVDVPVVLGGVTVRPGDIVVADADGVVVLDAGCQGSRGAVPAS